MISGEDALVAWIWTWLPSHQLGKEGSNWSERAMRPHHPLRLHFRSSCVSHSSLTFRRCLPHVRCTYHGGVPWILGLSSV